MGYYYLLAIVPSGLSDDKTLETIARAMEPFAYGHRVPVRCPLCDASPECDNCDGTGSVKIKNRHWKWDSWRIGGRFDGIINQDHRRSDFGYNIGEHHETLAANTAVVADIIRRWKPTHAPFAILTPDGAWSENIDEDDCRPWRILARKTLEQYADHTAVAIECHC